MGLREIFNSRYKVTCACGAKMIVDDIDGGSRYNLKNAEIYLLCETCHCSCIVKDGKIFGWTDKDEIFHKE